MVIREPHAKYRAEVGLFSWLPLAFTIHTRSCQTAVTVLYADALDNGAVSRLQLDFSCGPGTLSLSPHCLPCSWQLPRLFINQFYMNDSFGLHAVVIATVKLSPPVCDPCVIKNESAQPFRIALEDSNPVNSTSMRVFQLKINWFQISYYPGERVNGAY